MWTTGLAPGHYVAAMITLQVGPAPGTHEVKMLDPVYAVDGLGLLPVSRGQAITIVVGE